MIIGITGSLATGKSAVAGYLKSYFKGYLIDADKIGHKILGKDGPAYNRAVSVFGRAVLNKKGKIERRILAKKAFSSKRSLKRLSDIAYPLIRERIKKQIAQLRKSKKNGFIIIDAAVLIEAGFYKECDKVIVVTSTLPLQIERILKSKALSPDDAMHRIGLQMAQSEKIRFADFIIDNGGSLKELKAECRELAEKIKKGSL